MEQPQQMNQRMQPQDINSSKTVEEEQNKKPRSKQHHKPKKRKPSQSQGESSKPQKQAKKKKRGKKPKEKKESESNAESTDKVKRQESAGESGEQKPKKKRRRRKKDVHSEQSKSKDQVKREELGQQASSKLEQNSESKKVKKKKTGRTKTEKPPVMSKKIVKPKLNKDLKIQKNAEELSIKKKRGRPKKQEPPRYKVVTYQGQGEHLFTDETIEKQFVFEVGNQQDNKIQGENVPVHKHVPDSKEIYEEEDSNESIESYYARVLHSKKDELSEISMNQSIVSEGYVNINDLVTPDLEPSQKEIDEVFKQLLEKFAQDNLCKLIPQLYTSLILKQSSGKDRKNQDVAKMEGNKMPPQIVESFANYEDNMQILVESRPSNTQKLYLKNNTVPKFPSKFEQQRWEQKCIVANSFVTRGYGLTQLGKYITQNGCNIYIERNRYKTLSVGIVVDAYRKLQHFLIYQCKKRIRPLNKDEIRRVVTTLQNCRRHFELQQYTTFLKFLRIVYGISSVTIKEEEAIRLYIVIQKTLRAILSELCLDRQFDTVRCNKQFKTSRSFQKERFLLHRIWSDELENQLLQKYQRNQTWIKIRDYFKQTYPQHQHYFTVQSLRSRLNKVLRVAIRKTKCFCDKFGKQRMPNLVRLTDHATKELARSPEALYARLLLIQIYLNDECDLKRLYQTVSAINQFAIMKDQQKANQLIEAEPILNSSTQKVLHNMNISRSKFSDTVVESKKQQFLFKGKQRGLQHIVHREKGGQLHYYRKSDSINPTISNISNVSNGVSSSGFSESRGESRVESTVGLLDKRPFQRTLQNFKAQSLINKRTFDPPVYLNEPEKDSDDEKMLGSMIQDELRRYQFTKPEDK